MASCNLAVVSHLLLYVGGGILEDLLDAAVATALCSRAEVAGADAAKAGPAMHPTRAVSSTAPRTGRRRQDGLSPCSMVPSYLTMSRNGAHHVPEAPSGFRSASMSPPPCSTTAALPTSSKITHPPLIRADTYNREIRTLPQGWGPSHSPSTYITRHVAGPLADQVLRRACVTSGRRPRSYVVIVPVGALVLLILLVPFVLAMTL
jgi:hypothetical protein